MTTYIVERTDTTGRIMTGYQQEIRAANAAEAAELWIEFYAADMGGDLWTCDVQQAAH
jgi:hypothetical protein